MTDREEELQKVSGIGPTTARRLIEAGYTTIDAIALASPEDLEAMTGDRGGAIIVAAREMTGEEVSEVRKEVGKVEEEEKGQGPLLDLVDKFTDKESTVTIDVKDFGGKIFGRSFRWQGKMNFSLGTLKTPKE